jgi:ketosteroid isomerase-like protein
MVEGHSQAGDVLGRLHDAMNRHDLEALVQCFREDFVSEQPAHPARNFRGREQVRRNWTQILGGIRDLKATLVRSAVQGDVVWAEWSWQGTRPDGSPADMAGVTVNGVADGQITWTHFFMEPVERQGVDIDAAVRRQAGAQ